MRDLTGVQVNYLIVIRKDIESGKWLCRCVCGTEKLLAETRLVRTNNKVKSCGCKKSELISKKNSRNLIDKQFGRLLVIERVGTDKNRHVLWKCLCHCGNYKTLNSNHLTRTKDSVKSCGNCINRVNGVQVSDTQVSLAKLIPNGELNYKVGRYYIDIALVSANIAIEYNSWFWHFNKRDNDKKRATYIINKGWKVLTIRGNVILPNIDAVLNAVQKLKTTTRKRMTITLKDWNTGSTYLDVLEKYGSISRKNAKHIITVGDKYGKLTILRETHRVNRKKCVECQCECGTIKVIPFNRLYSNITKSCGCLKRKIG